MRIRELAVVFGAVGFVASSSVGCTGGNSNAPSSNNGNSSSLSAVRAWTGTVDITAQQSGSGTSGFAGFVILENYRHDTTAHLALSLTRDPSSTELWTGAAQGSVHVQNSNSMNMTAPEGIVTCTGTLLWIGDEPLFSTTTRLEAASGGSIRLSLGRTTIPAPDSGTVVCPTTGAIFPTTDPNSPFAPIDLLSGFAMTPVVTNGNLFAAATLNGDSGIGGFVAGPARIAYLITVNLNAVP